MAELSTKDTATEFSDTAIDPFTAEWERDSENTPVYAIVSAVAEATGKDIFELPPIHDVIDSDALNTLFMSRPQPAVKKVAFQYAGYDIVVCGDGEVQVQQAV